MPEAGQKELLESLEGSMALAVLLPLLREIAHFIASSESKAPEISIPVTTSDLKYLRHVYRLKSGLCQHCGREHGANHEG